jgi:hypothetical protein
MPKKKTKIIVKGCTNEYLGVDIEDCDIIVEAFSPAIYFKENGRLYKANYIHFSREQEITNERPILYPNMGTPGRLTSKQRRHS